MLKKFKKPLKNGSSLFKSSWTKISNRFSSALRTALESIECRLNDNWNLLNLISIDYIWRLIAVATKKNRKSCYHIRSREKIINSTYFENFNFLTR